MSKLHSNEWFKNKWTKNKFIWLGATLLLVLILLGIGSVLLDGENPLKMGTTLWYLNSSDRNVLWLAGDGERYVTYNQGKEAHILSYLSRLDGVSRGDWELHHIDESIILYQEEDDKGIRQVEIIHEPYLEGYVIFTYQVSSQEKSKNQ